MIARIAAAAARAIMVVLLIVMPSLILAQGVDETPEGVVLLALLAGVLVFAEYNARAPSFVEFRNAPPLNRIRFGALLLILLGLSLMLRHDQDPTGLTTLFRGLGMKLGHWLDFPMSPVQLMTLIFPSETAPASLDLVRAAAGFAGCVAFAATVMVALAIRVAGWPVSAGSFNVWTNLPLFDPTTGGDVVQRMIRDGRLNVILGVLLPFAIPGLIKALGHFLEPSSFGQDMILTWGIAVWAFVPASLAMRGLAILRVADLIAAQRRRTYAASDQLQII